MITALTFILFTILVAALGVGISATAAHYQQSGVAGE